MYIEEMDGFEYCANVIDCEYENELVRWLESSELWAGVSSSKGARKVIHFGQPYTYKTNTKMVAYPIPDEFAQIVELIGCDEPLSCIVNRYEPGQGIAPHTDDKKFGPTIWCFTIGSGTQMLFEREKIIPIYVERCSMYVMAGECRTQWLHSIVARKSDMVGGKKIKRGIRYSLTFRTNKI
jgi:alkylated DNA repair dioxygenase AlkB